LGPLPANPLLVLLIIGMVITAGIAMVPALGRPRYLALLGIASAVAYFGAAFPAFVVVNTLAYLLVRAVAGASTRTARWRWALVAILAVSLVFIGGRAGRWMEHGVEIGPASLIFYGIDMWLLLRLVTLLWEVGSGRCTVPDPVAFVCWVAFPLTLGGPLVRYSEWRTDPEPVPATVKSAAWWRGVAEGAIKMIAASGLSVLPSLIPPTWPSAPLMTSVLVILLVGPVGFYLMFAGYFQIVERFAQVVGVRVPESFNWAFGRENIAVFWANWNMTAVRVFRDYLFYARWGLRRHYPYLNVIVLFTLVGLWHDAHPYWILWGFLHGLLFCAYLLWKRVSPALEWLPLRGTPVARAASRVLTYLAVCAGWYLPSKILETLG
jgi:D-alanyl-lipoteichoic acid acyltransferase DltB (MBOAT superfamily)